MSLTRSKVEDAMHPTDEPDAVESYYAILDYTIANLEYPMVYLKKDLPELYDHFCTVFQALRNMDQEPVMVPAAIHNYEEEVD